MRQKPPVHHRPPKKGTYPEELPDSSYVQPRHPPDQAEGRLMALLFLDGLFEPHKMLWLQRRRDCMARAKPQPIQVVLQRK